MARGSSEDFEQLHQRTLRILNKMMESAERGALLTQFTKEGEPVYGMPPPALLAQAIKFLKENGIDKPASSTERKDTLKDEMPDFDELEDNVVPFRK